MSEEGKKRLLRYGTTVLAGALLTAGVCALQGGFRGDMTLMDRYRLLSDMFTVPGLLLLFAAGLVLVSNNGVFDGIGFALSRTVAWLIPGRMITYKDESYKQYVARKHEKGRVTGFSCVAVTGLGFLAVGLIFLWLFYGTYG